MRRVLRGDVVDDRHLAPREGPIWVHRVCSHPGEPRGLRAAIIGITPSFTGIQQIHIPIRGEVWIKGQTEQASISKLVDLRLNVDKWGRQKRSVLNYPDDASLLPHEDPPVWGEREPNRCEGWERCNRL